MNGSIDKSMIDVLVSANVDVDVDVDADVNGTRSFFVHCKRNCPADRKLLQKQLPSQALHNTQTDSLGITR